MLADLADSMRGRRVVITGAGRGLGRALAIVMADFGAEVSLLGRDTGKLAAVADAIKSRSDVEPQIVACDLASPNSVATACAAVLEKNPVVDVLINNGAPWLVGSLDELSDEDVISAVSAAVTGSILVTKGLLGALRRSKAADIVNVVSTSGLLGWDVEGASVPFYAAKHGQSGFSNRLGTELKRDNVRVSALYPPDFDDSDPLDDDWNAPDQTSSGGTMTNREIVSTVLYILSSPRSCCFPLVVLENMR